MPEQEWSRSRCLTVAGVTAHWGVMTEDDEIPRPAASVIVARHNPRGEPYFLMQERAEAMRFAGGAMVFPGGAVDAADIVHAHALAPGGDVEGMAARIAAVRETIEECGLVLAGRDGGVSVDTVQALRDALSSGKGLADAAHGLGIAFDFDRLVPFARWCPSARAIRKRYDTRFFIAVLDQEEVPDTLIPDGGETTRLVWHRAHEVLEEARAGRVRVVFPTRRNLERLAQCDSVEALLDHARTHPVELITPWTESRDGVDHLCIPEGLGYPVTSEPLATALRA